MTYWDDKIFRVTDINESPPDGLKSGSENSGETITMSKIVSDKNVNPDSDEADVLLITPDPEKEIPVTPPSVWVQTWEAGSNYIAIAQRSTIRPSVQMCSRDTTPHYSANTDGVSDQQMIGSLGNRFIQTQYVDSTIEFQLCKQPTFSVVDTVMDFPREAIVPSQLFSSAMTLITGGDLGSVSRQLRTSLTQLYGDAMVRFGSGAGLTYQVGGLSSATVATRIALTMSLFDETDNQGDTRIVDRAWRPKGNLETSAFGYDDFDDQWPLSPFHGTVGDTDITAMICTFTEFVDLSNGVATPTAGWDVANWGATGLGGVAVVPILNTWANDAEGNALWALMHCEYPLNMIVHEGEIFRPSDGTLMTNNIFANVLPSLVRVPGPGGKILFVMVDMQHYTQQNIVVKFGTAGVDLTVNNVIGGDRKSVV